MKPSYENGSPTTFDKPQAWDLQPEFNTGYRNPVTCSYGTTYEPCKGIWVGGAGMIAASGSFGDPIKLYSVPAGTLIPVNGITVITAESTATHVTLLY